MNKLSRLIAYHPKIILLIAVILLIPSVAGYMGTKINYDILSYLPEDLKSVQGERILDETFNDAAMAILVIDDYNPAYAAALKDKISDIDGVVQVLWTNSILDITVPQEIYPDILKSTFYSEDGKSTMMLVQFAKGTSSESTLSAIAGIKKLMNENCYLSGLSAISAETKDMTDSQAPFYTVVAIVLALIVLSFTLKFYTLPFILLISLGFAVIYNMGSNIFLGEVSYLTQSITTILQLGVTMDYSVFLCDRFEEELPKYASKKDAMAAAIKGSFVALSGSSLTTVSGFFALCFMSFTLGLDLGIVMMKGVILGILTVLTVLPSFILIFDNLIIKTTHKRIVPDFNKLNGFLIRHKKAVALIFILLFIPSFIMSENVKLYYNMIKAMPETAQSVIALNKVKDEFRMATTHFIIVDSEMSASDTENMIEEIENTDGITEVMGINSIVGAMIPSSILPDEVKKLCIKDGWQLLLANTDYTASTDEGNAQIEQLENIVSKYDSDGFLTGEGVMTKDLIEVTTRDFTVTNIISIALIFIVIALCLKSLSLPLLLVMAIELAIMLNKAVSFAMGTELIFVAPTIIGCVQLGATVDYAILLSSRYKEELTNHPDKNKAMLVAANSSAISILQSALVFFAATFGVYIFCDIQIVKSICALLARGAIISAIVIIVLLPATLLTCNKFIEKLTLHWPKYQKPEEVVTDEK